MELVVECGVGNLDLDAAGAVFDVDVFVAVATLSMNNLYIETATELVSVFTLLKDAVAKGGRENMLTGAERSQTLWLLSDKLHSLSKKFQQLYLSVRYYNMTDVWQRASVGILDHRYSEIAGQSYSRWRRAAKVLSY